MMKKLLFILISVIAFLSCEVEETLESNEFEFNETVYNANFPEFKTDTVGIGVYYERFLASQGNVDCKWSDNSIEGYLFSESNDLFSSISCYIYNGFGYNYISYKLDFFDGYVWDEVKPATKYYLRDKYGTFDVIIEGGDTLNVYIGDGACYVSYDLD